jgi:hypothetical protein
MAKKGTALALKSAAKKAFPVTALALKSLRGDRKRVAAKDLPKLVTKSLLGFLYKPANAIRTGIRTGAKAIGEAITR